MLSSILDPTLYPIIILIMVPCKCYFLCQIMARRQNVHAHVNAGFLFRIHEHNNYIVEEKPTIVFGGISREFVKSIF